MIDLTQLRENTDLICARIKRKEPSFPIEKLYTLDQQVRSLRISVDQLRCTKNDLAKNAKSGITPEIREQSIIIGQQLKEQETILNEIERAFEELYLSCPDIPNDEIPDGGKPANKVVKVVGEKPQFSFVPRHHVDLGHALGWFDFNAAAKMSGSNFALYKGEIVRVMYALTMLMLKNNIKHGFDLILPSYLVNARALMAASNFPKFVDQVYKIPEDDLYLTPTAEVNLTNLYQDEILSKQELPKRMTAWTSCFRREAGSYGATERGLIRIHQFEKVELYTICEPDYAEQEQERMLTCAQEVLQLLGLHYRVSLLAAQDCSFPSVKTYDIEVWLPGQNGYYEVSSVSNCTDFQARRAGIRHRENADSKTKFVYTLNGSSLALPRLIVAIMETYQQEDGSIQLPKVLRDVMI